MKASKLFLYPLLLGALCMTACSKSDDEGGGAGNSTEWAESGSAVTTLRSDINTSALDTYLLYVAKLENLKLQTIKLFSNNWNGELFCGDMSNASSEKMDQLITELLENQDSYEAAAYELEQSGVLTGVTTRGVVSSVTDFLNSLSQVASDDEDLIKDALERSKMMGNKKAQQELFDALPGNLRQGSSSADDWFKRFNNHEFTNLAHRIKNEWYKTGLATGNDACMQFHENVNAITKTSQGDAMWSTGARVTKELAQKGMDVSLSTLDDVSGGGISKITDVNTVLEEVGKLRQKLKEGTLKSSDLNKIETVIGKNLLDLVLKKYIPSDTEELSDDALRRMQSELSDYVYEKELEAAEEDAAKGTDKSLVQIVKNLTDGSIGSVIAVGKDGKVNVGLPNKDGDVNVLTDADQQTLTTVTKDGQRSTQQVTTKAGKNEVDADPELATPVAEAVPEQLSFTSDADEDFIDVYTNIRYLRARSSNEWIHVSRNSNVVIVNVDENESDKARSGSVVIELSQDKEKILKTLTVPVIQQGAEQEEDDKKDYDLSFIRWDYLRITQTSFDMCDNQTFEGTWPELNRTFEHAELTIKKESASSYLITAKCADPDYNPNAKHQDDNYAGWRNQSVEKTYQAGKAYGLHFELSFRIKAKEPDLFIEQHNMEITDLKASGYKKYKAVSERTWDANNKPIYHIGDYYAEFSLESTEGAVTLDYEETENGSTTCLFENVLNTHRIKYKYGTRSHSWSYSIAGYDERNVPYYAWTEDDVSDYSGTYLRTRIWLDW